MSADVLIRHQTAKTNIAVKMLLKIQAPRYKLIPMSPSCFAVFAFIIGFAHTLLGDVVTLTDGQKIEGKILTETDDEIVMEVQVSATIGDVKTISKDEIDRVERTDSGDLAYAEIQSIQIGKNSLGAAGYQEALAQLQAYLKEHGDSEHAASVRATMAELEAEKARVDAGELKLDGKWLTSEQVETRKVEIGGRLRYSAMQDAVARRDWITAMNLFDSLEKNFSGATVYPDAVVLARQVVSNLSAELQTRLAHARRIQAEWQQGYDVSPVDRQQILAAAREKEKMQLETMMSQAVREGIRWLPIMERHEETILQNQKLVETEATRLAGIELDKMRTGTALAQEAEQALEAGEFDEAIRLANESKTAWPQCDAAARVLEQAQTAKTEAEKAPVPEVVDPAAPSPDGAAVDGAPVDGAATAGATPIATPIATPAQAASAPVEASMAEPEETAVEPPQKNFFLTLPGALTILGVILVVVTVVSLLGKPRRKPPATEE